MAELKTPAEHIAAEYTDKPHELVERIRPALWRELAEHLSRDWPKSPHVAKKIHDLANQDEATENYPDPLQWEDASPSDYLFVLRNIAGKAAEALAPQIEQAQAVLQRLNRLADDAEDAAQLVAASDIEPAMSANVPERSGLTRKEPS